jgi:glutaryl-CoA dehydrogenase (non-decarboxylating)
LGNLSNVLGSQIPDVATAPPSLRADLRAFVSSEITPFAETFDREQRLPAELIHKLARRGYLGALVPASFQGEPLDFLSFGILNEELGRGCSSTRSLITVHSMVCQALTRWGSREQQTRWLPALARGEAIGAFALSEPAVGSDAGAMQTTATAAGDGYRLQGRKRWVSFGQIADVFLVFARVSAQPCAFVVPRSAPGLTVTPIRDLLGTRASLLAELTLEDCHVSREHLVGAPGFGLAAVATAALDIGRYSVAWGCVGIAQACLEACLAHSEARVQGGVPLRNHQLIRQMLTDMITNTEAARLLCEKAGRLKDEGDPDTLFATLLAKYFASTAAARIASDAVQLHGASGCTPRHSVERMFRDAKIMEIIEGSTQIQQIEIAGAYRQP